METDWIIIIPFCALTFVACLFIITVSLSSNFLRKAYPFKFLVVMSFFDLFWTILRILPASYISHSMCMAQAVLNMVLSTSSVLWAGFMSLEMYNVVVLKKKQEHYGFNKPVFVVIVISILTCIPLYFLDQLGEAKGWCSITISKSDPLKSFLCRLFLYFLIVWIIVMWIIYVAIKTSKVLSCRLGNRDHIEIKKIQLYPLVLVACYLPNTLNRLLEIYVDVPVEFAIFTRCFRILFGFFNVIIFGCTDGVKNRILKCFKEKKKLMPGLLIS